LVTGKWYGISLCRFTNLVIPIAQETLCSLLQGAHCVEIVLSMVSWLESVCKMLKSVMSAVLALGAATTAMAQDIVTWNDNIGGWRIVVDRTIDDSCFIISEFEDNVLLRFQYNVAQQSVQFIVASVLWDSLKTGEDYDLEVTFGDFDTWFGMAKGHRWNDVLPSLVLSVPVEDQQASEFMKEFTSKNAVRISHNGDEIANLDLAGTHEAVASMLDCQATMSHVNVSTQPATDPFSDPT